VKLASINQELGRSGHGDLIRKIVTPETITQSHEMPSTPHRAMLENARHGFLERPVAAFWL